MSEKALATTAQKRDIRSYIQSDAVKDQLAMALPKHMTPDRMARVACTAILKTPKLLDCKPESLLQALMLCSQAGLEPDGRNAHLIPYGDTVQVIFDYKGLVALAERNGVECIYADKVCENDVFEAWVENGEKKLNHRIDFRKPRGAAYAYYSSCRRNGRLDYEVMTKDEVEAIRKRSRASGSGPWVTDYDEMAKKTVLRRHSKRWDLSPEALEALAHDYDSPEFGKPAPAIQPVAFVKPQTVVSVDAPKQASAIQPEPEVPSDFQPQQIHKDVADLALFVTSKGADFEKFKKGVKAMNVFPEAADWQSFGDVQPEIAAKLMANQSGLEFRLK